MRDLSFDTLADYQAGAIYLPNGVTLRYERGVTVTYDSIGGLMTNGRSAPAPMIVPRGFGYIVVDPASYVEPAQDPAELIVAADVPAADEPPRPPADEPDDEPDEPIEPDDAAAELLEAGLLEAARTTRADVPNGGTESPASNPMPSPAGAAIAAAGGGAFAAAAAPDDETEGDPDAQD